MQDNFQLNRNLPLNTDYDVLVIGGGPTGCAAAASTAREGAKTLLVNTALAAVDSNNGAVQTVVVNNKSGLTAYRADEYVDCTGDADLAAGAGAGFQKGDEQGGMQPGTLCFTLANVDTYGYLHTHGAFSGVFPPWKEIAEKIAASEKYPLLEDLNLNGTMIGPATVGFSMGHIDGVDNTDPETLSNAWMLVRRIAEQTRGALAEFFPQAFANAFLVNTGSLLGIRETRRIIGDYMLNRNDYVARRS